VNPRDLKPFALVEELSEEEREILCEELQREELASGEALFEEGAESDGMALLVEGELTLESRESGALGRVGAGAVLGALSLVAPGTRETSAVAASPCVVAWLDRSGFRRLVHDAPGVACKLQEAIVREAAGWLREALPLLRRAHAHRTPPAP